LRVKALPLIFFHMFVAFEKSHERRKSRQLIATFCIIEFLRPCTKPQMHGVPKRCIHFISLSFQIKLTQVSVFHLNHT